MASKDEVPCGMAFAGEEKDVFTIYLISVHSNFNDESVDEVLLDECVLLAKKLNAAAVECYCSGLECQTQGHWLTQKGFAEKSHTKDWEIFRSEANLKQWSDVMEKRGDRIIQKLRLKGFELKPFQEARSDVLASLYTQIGVSFPSYLDPRTRSGILADYSTVVVHRDEPVAFCLVTSDNNGKTITAEQLSVRFDYMNTGAFFPPIYFFIDKAVHEKVRCVMFSVRNGNSAMLRMLEGFLSFPDTLMAESRVYRREMPGLTQ